jgi:ankyrin repeat protein
MKHILITTIAAVVLVGCGESIPLWRAARDGNIEAVRQHLASGTDVDAKTDTGYAPLHFAANYGRKEIAELLISKGADVNAKSNKGITPLYFAKTKETADLLRKHGGKTGDELKAADKPTAPVAEAAQPEPTTAKAGDDSIFHAVITGIEAIKQHLDAGADVNAKAFSGWTALHYAAMYGRKEIAELLITKGADVNGKLDVPDMTPLHFAARGDNDATYAVGHKEVAELLIAAGADVNAKDESGETPLDSAIMNKQTELTALLRKHGGKSGADIHIAARTGNIEAVKQHIAAGTDVNAKSVDGWPWTPLQYAAKEGHKEIVELLITKGADLNAKIESTRFDPLKGYTPLDVAEEFNLPELASILRKHGGKRGEELENAEPVAEASKPEPPTVKAPDISIHDAARKGNIEAVKQHLAEGVDVNAKDELIGRTPLHMAAINGHKEIVELLIAEGASVNTQAAFPGWTPLDVAIINKKTETADLLRKHGGKTSEELKAEGK